MCMKHIYIAYIYTHPCLRGEERKQAAVSLWWWQAHHLAELLADVISRVLHTPFGEEKYLLCSLMAPFPLLPLQEPL